MQYFWVNQSNFNEEYELSLIKADTSSSTHHARVRIFDVRKGDVIFSFSKKGFQAVLIANEDADINIPNCRVDCTYNLLPIPFELNTVIDLVEEQMQELYSPIDSNSERCQGYLYPVNDNVAEILFEISGVEITPPDGNKGTGEKGTKRVDTLISRIVRNTKKSQNVKNLYSHSCQVCGIQLNTSNGPYAEGAHVIPLGRPHNGPDEESNILCLCPNHHVLLDSLSFSVSENGELIGFDGNLTINSNHKISKASLVWHQKMYNKALKRN
jgi:hypothetical protein